MKKVVLISFISACLVLSSCGRLSAWDKMKFTMDLLGLSEDSEYKESDNVKQELGSLSEDEMRILSRDGYSEKERIYAGQLYDYEVQKVKNIRGAKVYLAEKYPEYEFKITLYESRGKNSSSPTGNLGDDLIWLDIVGEDSGGWVKVKETDTGVEFEDNINP